MHERACIPILSHRDGSQVAVVGRTITGEKPKYLNTSFAKSRYLQGLWFAEQGIQERGFAIIVEDSISAIVGHQCGLTNVVATCGTALTIRQIGLLARLTDTFVLAFDNDEGGRKGSLRIKGGIDDTGREIPGLISGFPIRIEEVFLDKDLDELLLENLSLPRQLRTVEKESISPLSSIMKGFRNRGKDTWS